MSQSWILKIEGLGLETLMSHIGHPIFNVKYIKNNYCRPIELAAILKFLNTVPGTHCLAFPFV